VELVFDLGIYFIFLAIFLVLSIFIHEAGHLIFGLLSGYSFSAFRLPYFIIFKENGKVQCRKTKGFMGGQCLMRPPGGVEAFHFVWYNLGGGLLNLASALIMAAMIFFFSYHVIFLAWIVANMILAVASLVPFKSLYVPNDCRNIMTALQSEEAKRGFFLGLYIYSETAEGKRLRDFDRELFLVEDSADFNNYFVSYIVTCEAGRLYDLGEYDKSAEQYSRLDPDMLQPYYANSVNISLLYHYTVHAPDFSKAAKYYHAGDMKTHFKLKALVPGIARTFAAYEYFVNDNKEKGKALLEEAKTEAENFPNAGFRAMEMDYCRELEVMFMNM